ncbi:MAG: hypothetical protein GX126_07260 [Bacteroidales bacterium]|nr:hypothetical protein [Bacteroidales bacterium]
MDTDDLSKEAYDGIITEAEKLSHDLTLHYGLLSYECEDEAEYIEKAEKLTRNIMKIADYKLNDLFWGNPPDKKGLENTLKKILDNIEKIKSIPIEKRNFDF